MLVTGVFGARVNVLQPLNLPFIGEILEVFYYLLLQAEDTMSVIILTLLSLLNGL